MHRTFGDGLNSVSSSDLAKVGTTDTRVTDARLTAGRPRSRIRAVGRWAGRGLLAAVPLVAGASSCLDRPIGSPPPVTTNIFVDQITQTSVDKIDLLFMIDNSISMSDKQAILKAAVPDLVSRLVNPICVDANGGQFPPPTSADGTCPTGQTQQFNPVKDINIGIVTSSLGDVGANDACPLMGFSPSNYRLDNLDMAHLVGSLDRSTVKPDNGFLAWRAGTTDVDTFNKQFQQMVGDVGEHGCGWEASLESWYRFLVDPFPYQSLVRVTCPGSSQTGLNCVQPATDAQSRILLDQTVLDQRKAFLRDDSLVAIIMLSDENDCSVQVGNQTWVVLSISGTRPMFRGSSKCAEDPNDKCCYSCPLGPPDGCGAKDPICNPDPATNSTQDRLADPDDGKNLRCFDQKRRFGVDFLYPTQRYVNALTQFDICWNALDLSTDGCADADKRPNPLFAGCRQPSLVFLGGIVGVPWQSIASDVDSNGHPLTDPKQLRFQDYKELTTNNTWAQILGSPGVPWQPAANGKPEVPGQPGTPPSLPYMVEATAARQGINPGNQYNGREYDTTQGTTPNQAPTADDLEYACIFPLNPTRDCSKLNQSTDACDCFQGILNNPLCEQQPGQSQAGTTQYWAKGYPGLRELEVLKDFGQLSTNSIVASICARNVTDTQAPDYGYRPAIAAIVERLKEQLGNRCLPRSLTVNPADGTVPCTLVETTPQPDGACVCDPKFARQTPTPQVDSVVRAQLATQIGKPCGSADPNCTNACLCEVQQVQNVAGQNQSSLQTCQQNTDAAGVEGWCYVDADQNLGNAQLVANCPATERRLLRFVGRGLAPNTTTFVACTGSSFEARE